jgi:indole-3-glycerol phosphate synthase / phosphoribosylanthranilate isomerase
MSDFLKKIRTLTEARVAKAKDENTLGEITERRAHDFAAKLLSGFGPRIIAEVKRASPSRGAIALDLDPVEVAQQYFNEGAAVISVLTEPHYFGGSLETFKNIREALPEATLLLKDFIVDSYQLLQARAVGADAVLLMISLLGEEDFKKLFHEACRLGLTPLVEVHDASEMELALSVKAPVIGVNNRNLRTLEVSLETSRQLASMKTKGTVLVSESGIASRHEIDELSRLGFDAFLIGSSLMENSRPGEALRAILKNPLEIKICGVTRVADAVLAESLGATMIGIIFATESPRYVDIFQASAISKALSPKTKLVGVFTSEDDVLKTLETVDLQGVQFHNFDPSKNILNELKARGLFSVRAFNMTEKLNSSTVESSDCDLVLLDVAKGEAMHSLSSVYIKNLRLKRRFLIAGGIKPETVKGRVQDLQPYGIDLASGVETSPGIKSETKLQHLFNEIERSAR